MLDGKEEEEEDDEKRKKERRRTKSKFLHSIFSIVRRSRGILGLFFA